MEKENEELKKSFQEKEQELRVEKNKISDELRTLRKDFINLTKKCNLQEEEHKKEVATLKTKQKLEIERKVLERFQGESQEKEEERRSLEVVKRKLEQDRELLEMRLKKMENQNE